VGQRKDLTENVRAHLFSCVTLPSDIRQRTQEVRDAAQALIKRSRELSDRTDVLIREAEATSVRAAAGSPRRDAETRGLRV